MTSIPAQDTSVTTIKGWLPVGTHALLHRAAAISTARKLPYLGDLALALALIRSRS